MTKYLHLEESEQRELDALAKRNDDASLERFLELLKKEMVNPEGKPWSEQTLRESIRRFRPDFTESQIDIFVAGKAEPESEWHITEAMDRETEDFIAQVAGAYREINPGMPDDDVAEWVDKNKARVQAKSRQEGYGTYTISQLVSAVLQDDKDAAEQQEIPDALAVKHPGWSAEKRSDWIKKHEALLLAYKGLHPEWNGAQLVTAVDDDPGVMHEADIFKDIQPGAKVRGMGGPRPSAKDREALIASLKRAHPDWTDQQIEIFVKPGR